MKKLTRLWYKPSDFNISGSSIPESVADKLQKFHIVPMSFVRDDVGFPIWPSKKSGWRPYSWEIRNGRDGDSQHVFRLNSKGATDWTCEDFENNKDKLLKSMIENTDYIRICVYGTFIHADYKDVHGGKRVLFNYKEDSSGGWGWDFVKFI